MNEKRLITYLQDHLTGAVFGLELLEACKKHNPGTPVASFLSHLFDEIQKDRDVVVDLLDRLGAKPATTKKASAWAAEKAMRIKTKVAGYDALDRLEELEILVAGIRGKLDLWITLEAVSSADNRLRGIDYHALQERASQQIEDVEKHRLEAARAAFG